ncbi:MAG: Dihydroanticapsin 7-dehydrogenase [Deltaproteobacteria bacterium]|jgi:NAD(P)-dependent dehydrogenase (short-subunit alcohol dehydrogenase family)|nr:Dihydroanticapsin 7-dehydrogenase [Deltaproteobacteria bacterium]
MELGLTDKVVLITGGAKGIGAAALKEFLAEGCLVAFVDRDKTSGQALAKSSDSRVRFIEADLTSPEACKKSVEQTVSCFGGIDVLVNNAGFNDGLGLETPPEEFMISVQTNLLHVYAMTHYSLPHLRKRPGCLVNLGSKVSETGQGHTSAYAAAKGAISALTREWAVALAPENIRVNCVMPAECQTDQYEEFFQSQQNPEALRKAISNLVPLSRRLTTPEEIAQTIVFLASDKSSHTTGQHIFVDGGYTHFDRAVGHDHDKWQ